MADYQTYKKINGSEAFIDASIGAGQVVGLSTGIVCRSFYFNCCNNVPCNGGCCYLWTVPEGVTTIQFELVSGGGSGAPARCCGNAGAGMGGGGGGYATKMLYANCGHFTAGISSYTVCAASSSRCSCCGCCTGQSGCGFYGCPSFVLGGGLTDFCVQGGTYAGQRCTNSCYTCLRIAQRNNCFQGCSASAPALQNIADQMNLCNNFMICGLSGGELKHVNCHSNSWAIASGAAGPWSAQRNFSNTHCSKGNTRGCCYAPSLFPSGGGYSGSTQGSNCWGDWGNGGLVVVTTWS